MKTFTSTPSQKQVYDQLMNNDAVKFVSTTHYSGFARFEVRFQPRIDENSSVFHIMHLDVSRRGKIKPSVVIRQFGKSQVTKQQALKLLSIS